MHACMRTPLYACNNYLQPFLSMHSCTPLTPLYVAFLKFDILFNTPRASYSTCILAGSYIYTLIHILG